MDVLEQWVVDIFSKIKNKNIKPPSSEIKVPVFEKHQLGKQYFIVPSKELRSLHINFILPSFRQYYTKAPSKMITHLIGHESEGSILSLLKQKGWADELSVSVGIKCSNFEILKIGIALTENGLSILIHKKSLKISLPFLFKNKIILKIFWELFFNISI